MTDARFRAWRFLFPDIDVPEEQAGVSISARGGIEMVAGGDSVRQAILLLLSTVPGERVMRPTYGCELYQLVFSPNDDTTAGLAIHYVRRALERWEPRVEIVKIDAGRVEGAPSQLSVELDYRVRSTREHGSIVFAVDLEAGSV